MLNGRSPGRGTTASADIGADAPTADREDVNLRSSFDACRQINGKSAGRGTILRENSHLSESDRCECLLMFDFAAKAW